MLTNDRHFMKLMSKPKQLKYDLILRCVTLITKRGGNKGSGQYDSCLLHVSK